MTLTAVLTCLFFTAWALFQAEPDDSAEQPPQPEAQSHSSNIQEVKEPNDESPLTYQVWARSETISMGDSLWLDTTLTNRGSAPITVYWGDNAFPNMYQFEIRGPDGRRVPTGRLWPETADLPKAAHGRNFHMIKPGGQIGYPIVLGPLPGGNCQKVFFNRPGVYTIEARLHVQTDHLVDSGSGQVRKVADAWTGTVFGPRLTVQVKAPAIPDPQSVRFTGQVTGPDGNPLPAALVRTRYRRQSNGGYIGWIKRDGPQDHTDEEGKFDIPNVVGTSPSYELIAVHPKLGIKTVRVANRGKRVYEQDLQLEEGISLRGQVRNQEGLPIPGARVSSYSSHTVHQTCSADSRGQFVLDGNPRRDEYTVRVWSPGYNDYSTEISRSEATNGSWLVELSKETLRGIAVLTDGTLLSKSKLTFQFERSDGKGTPRVLETTTDTQGRFAMKLPTPDTYNLTIQAKVTSQRNDILEVQINDVAPRPDELRCEFRSGASLEIEVATSNNLPSDISLQVHFLRKTIEGYDIAFRENRLGNEGGTILHQNIAPGDYNVLVKFENAKRWSYSKRVTVEPNTKEPTRVRLRLPVFEFGRAEGTVYLPDGSPASDFRMGFRTPHTSGPLGSLHTDSRGEFVLDPVPAGRLYITTYGRRYYDDKSFFTDIPAGGTGRLKVQLRDIDEVTGVVAGQVSFEDGTPAAGVSTGPLRMHRVTMGSKGGMKRLPSLPVGGYTRRLPAGRQWMSFSMWGAGLVLSAHGWPNGVANSLPITEHERIAFPVEVEVGKTLKRDLTMPPLDSGNVNVTWSGLAAADISTCDVFIDTESFQYQRTVFVSEDDRHAGAVRIADLPPGPRTLVLSSRVDGHWLAADAGEAGDTQVHFDGSKRGCVLVRMLNAQGKPLLDGAVKIESTNMPRARYEWSAEPLVRRLEPRFPFTDKSVSVTEDGTHILPLCYAGSYRMHVASGDESQQNAWSEGFEFDLLPASELTIEARMDADGGFVFRK